MFFGVGGSIACCRVCSIAPRFQILILSMASCKLRRSISGIDCSSIKLSYRFRETRWKQRPGCTRAARPLRCRLEALEMKPSVNFDICLRSSKRMIFSLQVSITAVISGIVTPVSAMLVDITIFLIPAGGIRNARSRSSVENDECSICITQPRWNIRSPSKALFNLRISPMPGMNTNIA